MSDLIQVRVSNLVGAPLDWAVAKATAAGEIKVSEQGVSCIYDTPEGGCWTNLYQPSKDWSQGGLLIDEHSGKSQHIPGLPDDVCYAGGPAGARVWCYGPTALVAFCRGLVNHRLGNIVQIPKELIP
ncbi:phage protein NinX family protein [Pseudomonas taiwanensis]|uniref:phage protein NinX family protein n=1 Tax=Pseudomonas taiwanensis TaxID=470150 RepID=UPI0004240CE5|nr:phage protein NinX family protein [Pseudomonas taiwanensis]